MSVHWTGKGEILVQNSAIELDILLLSYHWLNVVVTTCFRHVIKNTELMVNGALVCAPHECHVSGYTKIEYSNLGVHSR